MTVLAVLGAGLLAGLLLGATLARAVSGAHRPIQGSQQPVSAELAALRLRVQVADALAAREGQRAEQAAAGTAALLSGLLAAEEAARGQLAAELHDTVAQSLLLARSRLAGRDHDHDHDRGLSGAEAEHVEELVVESEEQLRGVIARTRPPALASGSLGAAVNDLCADFEHRYGLTVTAQWVADSVPVPMTVAVPVYRFFAEALLNIVKHADEDLAVLSLRVHKGWVIAEVGDTGPGFAPEQVRPRAGRQVGLDLLGARVRLAGGALDVISAPGSGTTVGLRLPLHGSVPPLPAEDAVPSAAVPGQRAATAGS